MRMTGWTDERVERAKKLWMDGWSAGQIAKELGDVSRNGVIGKLHRLGLSSRDQPSDPGDRHPKANLRLGDMKVRAPKIRKPVIVAGNGAVHDAPAPRAPLVVIPSRAWRPLPGSTPRPWTERGNGCKWPVDVAGAEVQHACCDPKGDDPSYCVPHRKLATSPQQPAASAKARTSELIRSTRRYAA